MIFISYSGVQASTAGELKAALDNLNYESFLAHEDIDEGEEWLDMIWTTLHESTAFIGLVSADFNQSPWCQQEAGVALAIGLPCMFVKLTSADPPAFASKYQATKLKSVPEKLTKKKFRAARIHSFIHRVGTVGNFAGANSLHDSFAREWEEMSLEQQVQWLERAVRNSQVYDEGYRMGPFFNRVASQLGPTLPQAWFDGDDHRWRVPRS